MVKPINNLPDPGTTVTAGLSAEMTIDNVDEPVVNVGISLDSGPVGDIADWISGWESTTKAEIKKGFGDHLGFFSTARYDTGVSVRMAGPELVYGHAELAPQKAIDIVVVSDGFSDTNMADFRAVLNAFISQMTTPESNNGNEPFYSLRSAIRIWKIEVVSAVPSSASHRVVTGYDDVPSGSRKTALANLARLGTIGAKAETVDADVVVFMSDRDTFGGDARAMAMGSVVMLPVSKSSASGDAAVLLHELGHTVLGGLADEYIEDMGIPHNALSSIRTTTDAASVKGTDTRGEAILFVDGDFRGAHKHVYASDGRLDFADRASSMVVLSGNWKLFRDSDFRTPYPVVLGPGLYASLSAVGIGNDAVSAIQATNETPTHRGAPVEGQLLLFEDTGMRGGHKHVLRAEPRLDFGDRASSLAVLSSNWQLARDADFQQPYTPIFGRGYYPELVSLGVGNDAVSAARPSTVPSSVRPPIRRIEGHIVLFESPDFRGGHKHVVGPERELDFGGTSSMATYSGTGPMTTRGQEWTFTARFGDVLRLTVASGNLFVPANPLPKLSLEVRCDLSLRDIAQRRRACLRSIRTRTTSASKTFMVSEPLPPRTPAANPRLVTATTGERLPCSGGLYSRVMRHVDLWRSRLNEVPDGIWDNLDVESLNLAENELRSIPDRFGRFTRLRMLDLGHNQLESIPDSIGQLVGLSDYLYLSDNNFTTVPDWIGNLVALKYLNVSDNQLETIPESIGSMHALRELRAYNNKLTGCPSRLAVSRIFASCTCATTCWLPCQTRSAASQTCASCDCATTACMPCPRRCARLRGSQGLISVKTSWSDCRSG